MPVQSTSILGLSTRRRSADGSLSNRAYRRIKDKIVTLELAPASVLDEAALAAELDIGLTPIRQALRQLAYENLVVILPRRGTIVADLNLSDLQKVFEMRLELEGLAARLAAQRAQPAEIEGMQELCLEADRLLATGNNQQFIALDHRFHRSLWQASHNEFLEETLDRLYTHVLRLWNVSIHRVAGLGQAMAEHAALTEAILQGEEQTAAAIMHRHVAHFQEEMTALQ